MRVTSYKLQVISLLLASCFLLLASARSAYAHELETDGNIGAVIHTEPDDEPVAGKQASFFFEFKDKSGKFDPSKCDCTGKILQNGKVLFQTPLFQSGSVPSLANASFSYTFPKKDAYIVQVVGKPFTAGAFDSFVLNWDIKVEKDADGTASAGNNQKSSWLGVHAIHFLLIVPATLFMIFYILSSRQKTKRDDKD